MEPPGIYRTSAAPGSARANADREQAAWPCRLAELRFCGVYLPAELLLSRPLHSGWLLSTDIGVDVRVSTFYASLNPQERTPLSPLIVHLGEDRVRQNHDGTYLIHGRAWDAGHLNKWPQTWLCGPEDEVVAIALKRMSAWLRQRYTGQFRT